MQAYFSNCFVDSYYLPKMKRMGELQIDLVMLWMFFIHYLGFVDCQ